MDFLNNEHKERFKLLERFSGRIDRERLPLFYILAAFEDTSERAAKFYNFEENHIKPQSLNRIALDYDSHKALVKLAFNLYNNATNCNICETMIICGEQERKVALEAIKIRFDM